jgi:eukaryotic-like serine/threonine-protein kinase
LTVPTLQNYHFLEPLGRGGTAMVFKAVDENSGFLVAVKMLYKQAFANAYVKQKFVEEANRYLYLDHPNIVKLKDFIIRDEAYYLVMEYIEGKPLDVFIRDVTGPVPEEVASAMLIEVLKAVDFAHQNGVIHLDLKPANIMVADSGEIKVLDFGIAVDVEQDVGKVMGSPLYMAPEQVMGEKPDFGTDIYALGVTLFQMIAGRPPYPNNVGREELFKLIKTKSIPGLAEVEMSGRMKQIISFATKKNRKDRITSGLEFISLLETL